MARICEDCRKKSMSGHNVSHSKRRTKRRFYPNLHQYTVVERGMKKRLTLCTRCIRTRRKRMRVAVQTAVSSVDTAPSVAARA